MLSLLLLAGAAPALADLTQLDRGVERFAGAALGTPGGPAAPIDRRLRLTRCGASPDFSWRTPARDAVVVRCPDPAGWRLFVMLKPGAVVYGAAPRAEPVIRRGDPVTLTAASQGFAVSADGVAMADALPGARFQVKIDGARAAVQAIAVEAGRATLPGW